MIFYCCYYYCYLHAVVVVDYVDDDCVAVTVAVAVHSVADVAVVSVDDVCCDGVGGVTVVVSCVVSVGGGVGGCVVFLQFDF